MKNRLRDLVSSLVLLLAFSGCSDGLSLGDDPSARIVEILEIRDRLDRTESLLSALRAYPADHTEEFHAILKGLQTPNREMERVLIVTAWAQHDPESATKWAMYAERGKSIQSSIWEESVYAWALADPKSIRTDFDLGMYSLRGWNPTMMRALVRGWYESGEPHLDTFIRDLGRQSDDRQRAISEFIKLKAEDETPDAMIAWATALDGGDSYRSYVYGRLAANIAQTDPARAVAWCDEICDSKLGESLPQWIAPSWVASDGAAAMDWIAARPNSMTTRVAIRTAYRRFMKEAPEEAEAWIEKAPEEDRFGVLLQGPVIMYVERRAQGYPEVAIEWTKYIEDDWERERSLELIAKRWLRRDQDAAEVWLADTTLLADDVKLDVRKKRRVQLERARKKRENMKPKPAWLDLGADVKWPFKKEPLGPVPVVPLEPAAEAE